MSFVLSQPDFKFIKSRLLWTKSTTLPTNNMEELKLSMSQQFAIERFNRDIDNCNNIDELRKIAKNLLQAWEMQKAATNWVIRQNMTPLS